jgi:hypothetical protein
MEAVTVKVYTGNILQEHTVKISDHIKERLGFLRERDFVDTVRAYLDPEHPYGRVMAVSGLRGMGKTVGILQAAEKFCDDVLYIEADEEVVDGDTIKGDTADDVIGVIEENNKNIVIIDEFTWIRNREKLDSYLATLIKHGHKVVVTGTESFALEYLNYGKLNHRADIVHVNSFPYAEYLWLYDHDDSYDRYQEYLIKGGCFEEYAVTNFDSMADYIKTGIIDNLVRYGRDSGRVIDEEIATAAVYTLFYKAVCPSSQKDIAVYRENRILYDDYLRLFGINPNIPGDDMFNIQLNRIADVLIDAKVLIRADNLDKKSGNKFQYYITNPSITCQMLKAVYGFTDIPSGIMGYVHEAVCMSLMNSIKGEKDRLGFIETAGKDNNLQVDMVLTDSGMQNAYLFECKNRNHVYLAENASVLRDEVEEYFPDGMVSGIYVVSPCKSEYKKVKGKDVIFTHDEDILTEYDMFEKHVRDLLSTYGETATHNAGCEPDTEEDFIR